MVQRRKPFFGKNKNNDDETYPKSYQSKRVENRGHGTIDNSSSNELQKSLNDKILEMEHKEILEALKEHYSTSGMGFKQKYRTKLKCPPEWIRILNEAGIDENEIISNIRTNDILEFFNNEHIVFKLTDNEMFQIKSLIKDQITLESDLDLGLISCSDEVYDLISRLAKSNGDLLKMTTKDQAAVLTLIQFNNITPSFGDDFNESAIDVCMKEGGEFIEFVDYMGTEIFVRKSSLVKAQILEEKIIEELKKFSVTTNKKTSFMIFCGILYLGLKIFVFLLAWLYMGSNEGYARAMFEIKN